MKKIIMLFIFAVLIICVNNKVFAQNDRQIKPPTINVPAVPSEVRQPPASPAGINQPGSGYSPYMQQGVPQIPANPVQNIIPAPALFSQMVGKLTYKELVEDGNYTLGIKGNVFNEEVKVSFVTGKSRILIDGKPADIRDLKIGDPVNAVYQGTLGSDKLSQVIILSVIPQEFLEETEEELKKAYDKTQ